MVNHMKHTWPVALKLYVDDLTITATAPGTEAAATVAEATDYAVHTFQERMGLKVSPTKSLAVASNIRTLRRLTLSTATTSRLSR